MVVGKKVGVEDTVGRVSDQLVEAGEGPVEMAQNMGEDA